MHPKVSNGTFDGLKTITILSLRKNFIEELGASVFTDLVRVEELDLGQAGLHSPSKIKLEQQKLFSEPDPHSGPGHILRLTTSAGALPGRQ